MELGQSVLCLATESNSLNPPIILQQAVCVVLYLPRQPTADDLMRTLFPSSCERLSGENPEIPVYNLTPSEAGNEDRQRMARLTNPDQERKDRH